MTLNGVIALFVSFHWIR